MSSHANEEMSEDELEAIDIENIILTGKIVRKFTYDPRGTRYQIIRNTTDNRRAHTVCRFLNSGILLIITVFINRK
ncbi:MAG: DUF4258 domain-containing protein [bacterium]